jgi:hypothetical protein
MSGSLRISCFILVLLLGSKAALWSQQDSLRQEKSVVLEGKWVVGEKAYEAPFQLVDLTPQMLKYRFELDSIPRDSLFLRFEGVAWNASLELNRYFLGTHSAPFQPWEVALAPSWLKAGPNELILRLSKGTQDSFYPRFFLGIYRPVTLQGQPWTQPVLDIPSQPGPQDVVGAWAPFFGASGFIFDEFEAAKVGTHFEREGIKWVYFPFPPGPSLRAFCKRLGLQEVQRLSPSQRVAWINYYPYEPGVARFHPPFWLNEKGERTRHYGCFYNAFGSSDESLAEGHRFPLVLLILFPWFSLMAVKLLSPGFLTSWKTFFVNARNYIDHFSDLTSSNLALSLILQLVRILVRTCVLTLVLYYIKESNHWDLLNGLKDWSLLSRIFYGTPDLGVLFWKSLLIMVTWYCAEQVLGWMGSFFFKIKGFRSGLVQLEVMSAFPLLWLLPLPWAFVLFGSDPFRQLFLWLGLGLLLFYLFRRLYVSYLGLEKWFGFSAGIKILYICALNILPYVIWF